MKILKQIAIIFAFAYAGEILARVIPGKLPASVIGLVLLLAALGFRFLKQEHIGETADFLSGIMGLFFLPLMVTIIQNFDLIKPVLAQILFICVTCTLFTFFVSYGTVRLLKILLNRIALNRKK
jgi:holin-like protein